MQAATRLKLGGFTSALAVNLLDRFIASHEVQVCSRTLSMAASANTIQEVGAPATRTSNTP